MPATIVEIGIATPDFEYDQETLKRHMVRWLDENAASSSSSYGATFDSNLVDRRSFAVPVDFLLKERTFEDSNDTYIRCALELGERAVVACLEKAKVGPEAVDHFISTSCTGFMIPSIDARLGHKLGMKRTLSRLPITEHGCAAGAVALAQAAEHLKAYPEHRVLVLSVELASLTFLLRDLSAENIISAGLFGDGAAAALITNERCAGRPEIVAAESRLFPDSVDLMGFKLTNSGFKIVLSRRVPAAIREHAVPALVDFLERYGLSPARVDHWLLHPGGRKVIECFEDAFELGRGGLELSRRVLRTHGNLSSATVLYILDDFLTRGLGKAGDVGVLVAFGPGFGAEMLLLKWP